MQKKISRSIAFLLAFALVAGLVFSGNVQLAARAEEAISGQCGDNLYWYYDEATGTLTIEGDGELWDYDQAELAPWAVYAGNIKKIVFSSGVTVIGKNAFAGCAVETIELPDTLTTIKEGAFQGCTQLVEVDASGTQLTTIEANAFVGCEALTAEAISLPLTVTFASETAFDVAVTITKDPEPTVPAIMEPTPTEPIPAPTEPPFTGTKTYTHDYAKVTEKWVDGVLVERVEKLGLRDTIIYTDFDSNSKPQSVVRHFYDNVLSTELCTYDDQGRMIKLESTSPSGTKQIQEFTYTSDLEGEVTYTILRTLGDGTEWSDVGSGTVRLHENGIIAQIDINTETWSSTKKYDSEGRIESEQEKDIHWSSTYNYDKGVYCGYVRYNCYGQLFDTMVNTLREDGTIAKREYFYENQSFRDERYELIIFDEQDRAISRRTEYIDEEGIVRYKIYETSGSEEVLIESGIVSETGEDIKDDMFAEKAALMILEKIDEEPSEDEEPAEDEKPAEDEEPTEGGNSNEEEEPTEGGNSNEEEEPTEGGNSNEEEEPTEGGDSNEEEEPTEGGDSNEEEEPTEGGDTNEEEEPTEGGNSNEEEEPTEGGNSNEEEEPTEGGDPNEEEEPTEEEAL